METPLKQRLIGAAVLAALAIIFLPMLLKGPDVKEPDAAEVPLSMPAAPGDAFETRELPLTAPEGATPADGVLGMKPAPAADAAPVPVPGGAAPGVGDAAPAADGDAVATAPEPAAAPAAVPPVQPADTVASKPAAPASPAAEVSAAPAEVAAGGHALTVGTFANATSAATLAARLRAAGLAVMSERVTLASGTATRVRVGPFASRAAAEAARQRVEQISGAPSKAVVLDAQAAAPATAPTKAPVAPAPKPAATAPTGTTATSTAAPAATARPAASSGFAVQLSAPSVEADANALRDRARAAGFPAFVQRVDTPNGVRYRVRLGPVADRAAAESLQADAKAKLGVAGFVAAHP